MSGIIMCTILLEDFMCFRSGCAAEMESCERWDVGFPSYAVAVSVKRQECQGEHCSVPLFWMP
jgi:hypothetical protein